MTYALESKKETERLEKQSEVQGYDYRKELSEIPNLDNKKICDAGCGSAIVSRYLADRFPSAQIYACDASDIRLHQSKALSTRHKNITFKN